MLFEKTKPILGKGKSKKAKGKSFVIGYFLLSIDYFSVASVLSVTQTTVLIGINPCLTESDLKKQSQFSNGQNELKYLYERRL